MDFEWDTDNNDQLESFINLKLEEAKAYNDKLRNHLKKKKDTINNFVTSKESSNSSSLINIDSVWKRRIGDSLIVGFVCNQNLINSQNVKVVLNWDNDEPLIYSTRTFYQVKNASKPTQIFQYTNILKALEDTQESELKYSASEWIESSNNFSDITCVFPMPNFFEKHEYFLNGVMLLKINTDEIQISLPNFKISVKDFYSTDLMITPLNLRNYEKEAILSYLSIISKVEIAFLVEKTNIRSLDSIFNESFTKVLSTEGLFLSEGVSCSCLGPVIKIHKSLKDRIYLTHIFYWKTKDLELILHFLLEKYPFLIILPQKNIHMKNCQDFLSEMVSKNTSWQNGLKKLGNSLESEIKLLETNLMNQLTEEDKNTDNISFSLDIEKYVKLRRELAELENCTELIYWTLNTFVKIDEITSGI